MAGIEMGFVPGGGTRKVSFIGTFWGLSMQQQGVNKSRRQFLIGTTVVVGGAGAAASAIPFVASMSPSARAEAAGAPVEADISKLEMGGRITVEWRGKPVWIVKRPPEAMEILNSLGDDALVDPESDRNQQPSYAKNSHRSRDTQAEILVMVGICTHLGCSPSFFPEMQPQKFDSDWKGGFFCPCHGSKFDLAGRVYNGAPAPSNMVVPPYEFLSENRILIGADEEAA